MLVPGAGGDVDDHGLVALGRGLADRGHLVVRARLPYREAGRSSPPRAERSAPAYAAIAEDARRRLAPDRDWALGGKSYGGRVASLAVADGAPAAALVFYGYPLHPPGKPDRLRVDHWPDVTAPCLFLQGDRDPLCDLDLLRAHLPELAGEPALRVVEGGDHSLNVRGSAATRRRGAAEVLTELVAEVADWLASL